MKHSLTVVTFLVLVSPCLLAAKGQGRGEGGPHPRQERVRTAVMRIASTQEASTPPTRGGNSAAAKPVAADGNALVMQASRELAALPSLDARLRLTTNLLGQELVGSGTYYQLGHQEETLLKLELKLQVANQVSSLLQVSDGRFLWIRKDLPQQKSLGRVDMRHVRQAMIRSQATAAPQAPTTWMALGGLGQLVESLATNFTFAAPVEARYGQLPVWVVEGTWKPEQLARIWTAQADALQAGRAVDMSELPAHLPHSVRLVVGKEGPLPLFPYRIEYRRADGGSEPVSLVTLDLFDVRRNVSLDPRLFSYKPGDQEVADQTEAFLKSLGLK